MWITLSSYFFNSVFILKHLPYPTFFRTFIFTILALLAFAANSVLCRLALGEQTIDAANFTILRLASGIVTLLIILFFSQNINAKDKITNIPVSINSLKGSWTASLFLFVYALCFSFAYVSLETGSGALILFAAVQITMILRAVFAGNKLHFIEWLGLLLAFVGFVYLIYPTISTPSILGFVLMTIAGVAWGFYTLKGRNSSQPLTDTAYNFLRTLPLVLLLTILNLHSGYYTSTGIFYAILSGAIASGIGYSLWYAALSGLSTTQAAVVQLLVPVIATLGGVILVSETINQRFVISSVMVLGGILLVMLASYKQKLLMNKIN